MHKPGSPLLAAAALLLLLFSALDSAHAQVRFRRGDSNASSTMDLSDGIHVLGFLFRGDPAALGCKDASDANDDGGLDLSDGISIFARLFQGDPPLPAPFEECGVDGTADALDCGAFAPCPPEPPATTTYRITDLDIRDPHIFVNALGCRDVTDTPFLGLAVNAELAEALTVDGDGDGFLDVSFLLIFSSPPNAAGGQVEAAEGRCTAPVAGTTCTPATSYGETAFTGQAAGTCLEALPGTVRPYTPPVAAATAPCFAASPISLTLPLAGILVPLVGVRIAATTTAADPPGLVNGLLRGFLSQATADATLLPDSLPLVGGQPLSLVLPGGAGSCADHDGRDTLGATVGWWFYLNFTAEEVATES